MSSIVNLLTISEDTGEEVIKGFKSIEDIIEELRESAVVLYLSYSGGLRLQSAIMKFRHAVAIRDEEDEDVEDPLDPETVLSEDEKGLIYAAYLMS